MEQIRPEIGCKDSPAKLREEKRARILQEKRKHPIILSPGCGGVHWSEHVEKLTITEGILGVVQFKLLRGLSVYDTSSSTGKLWLATLEYISTIQGCAVRYWGTETFEGQESICLLVQFENARRWGEFQHSLGIGLMELLPDGRVMNRCLRLSLPIRVELPNRLKVLRLKFGSEVFTTNSDKVLEVWRRWENKWRQEGVEAFGSWLEDDAAQPRVELADLISAAEKGQDKVFLVLAFDWDMEEVKRAGTDARTLEAELKEEIMSVGAKRFTTNEFLLSTLARMESQTRRNDLSSETDTKHTVDRLASLLQLTPPRRHTQTPSTDLRIDSIQADSIYAAAAGKRQFPGPSGTYKKMGNFHENMHIPLKRESARLKTSPLTDFLWLKFKPGGHDTDDTISKSLVELRQNMKRDVGDRASFYWGRSVDNLDEWYLMIDWDREVDRFEYNPRPVDLTTKSKIAQDLLEDFVRRTEALTKESGPSKVGFNYSRYAYAPPRPEGFPILEVTTSIIGSEVQWRSLLRDFPPDPASLPLTGCVPVQQAGRGTSHFFHNHPTPPSTSDTETTEVQTPIKSYFTAITAWRSVDAMREWYTDFASHYIPNRAEKGLALITTVLLAKQSTAASSAIDYWLAAHPISTRTSSASPTSTSVSNTNANSSLIFNSALSRCPASCSDAGSNPANWTAYHDIRRLAVCNETMLLDFTIYNSLNDSNTQATIYSCKTDSTQSKSNSLPKRDAICQLGNNQRQTELSLERGWLGASGQDTSDVVSAAKQLKDYIAPKEDDCSEISAFAYSGTVAMGIYAGSKIQFGSSILDDFIAEISTNGVSDTLFVQHCAGNGLNGNYAFGIVARLDGNLADVQGAVRTWRDSGCITSYDGASAWKIFTISLPVEVDMSNSTSTNSTLTAFKDKRSLRQRDTCTTIQVASGDSCGTLAAECAPHSVRPWR
ncbi:class V chitinase protein [Rutstroemia sp. NJR-2017a BBW]|nr:class V chitinase protein [Rutstroemia sp. NJR-2017a BBW]